MPPNSYVNSKFAKIDLINSLFSSQEGLKSIKMVLLSIESLLPFSHGFLWGTATSSHQVEGGNANNNWSAWENTPGKIVNGEKRLACDWWGGRWQEDFDHAAEGGQTSHRLSLEWSRIQPSRDRWDESSLAYYREMIAGLNIAWHQTHDHPAPLHRSTLAL